jgi:uncharacterized Zn-finger protein
MIFRTMKKPVETIQTSETQIACDGGNDGLGHPRVFLTINKDGFVDCPYCGRHYVYVSDQKMPDQKIVAH